MTAIAVTKSSIVTETIHRPLRVISTAILMVLESVCHNENVFLLWMFVLENNSNVCMQLYK